MLKGLDLLYEDMCKKEEVASTQQNTEIDIDAIAEKIIEKMTKNESEEINNEN